MDNQFCYDCDEYAIGYDEYGPYPRCVYKGIVLSETATMLSRNVLPGTLGYCEGFTYNSIDPKRVIQ